MIVCFDTEFIEDGRTIDLISIGLVREDGCSLYLESAECDLSRASLWVRDNVFPHLTGVRTARAEMAREIALFVGADPEFWAYYADYDWVALCQLYGTMMELPKGWPMFCRDLRQITADTATPPMQHGDDEHNALQDARWVLRTLLPLRRPPPSP